MQAICGIWCFLCPWPWGPDEALVAGLTAGCCASLCQPAQDVRSSLKYWAGNLRVMALIILPFARAASSESLTAVYARTFERAAFGFAKVRNEDTVCHGWLHASAGRMSMLPGQIHMG